MKDKEFMKSLKYFITLIIAVAIGSFFTNMLYRIDSNVWLARGIGCAICVAIGLLLNHFWLNKDRNTIKK